MVLSSSEIIEKTIQKKTNDFSFVNTIGSFINNSTFEQGFTDFLMGEKTKKSNIWETLSSIGQNLGESLYSNILNYIDNVSNVDSCRIKALKSMCKLVDLDYELLNKVSYYPLEILNLIDILSINKKYLFSNKYIKQDFIDELSSNNIIYLNDEDHPLSSDENYIYSEDNYKHYIINTISNFIYDIFTTPISKQDEEYRPIYTEITSNYGNYKYVETEEDDVINNYKKVNNINKFFNPSTIATDINIGSDSIDNYNGYEKELIQKVLDLRDEALTQRKYDKTTRFFYYRKQKVQEYAEFIDNTYSQLSNILNNTKYNYDNNYLLMSSTKGKYVIDNGKLDTNMIVNVSNILYAIISQIVKLREQIKKQVRKIYMKGTNNLLQFTINEFMYDYIEQLKTHVENENNQELSTEISVINDIYNTLKQSTISLYERVKVQEYWDDTEYMNIKTNSSGNSLNKNNVNGRFFDTYFQLVNGNLEAKNPKTFSLDQINDFYLNTLNLKQNIGNSTQEYNNSYKLQQDFYQFLSVLFDVGSNSTYYDQDLSVYGVKLSSGIMSTEKHPYLMKIIETSSYINTTKRYTNNYEFQTETTIQDQCDDFKTNYNNYLSSEYLSAVSSIYLIYQPVLDNLSSKLDTAKEELETYLSDTYSYYFCKSDNKYCQNEDGSYTLDYFCGNDIYPEDDYYITRLENANEWIQIENNCRNWPILCADEKLQNNYSLLSSRLDSEIINNIVLSGFYALHQEDLSKQLDDIDKFLNDKISERKEYLNQALENLRTQANQLKTTHDGLEQTFDQVIARNPGITEQDYYFTWKGADINDKDKTIGLGSYVVAQEDKRTKGDSGLVLTEGSPKNPVKKFGDIVAHAVHDIFSGLYFIENYEKRDGEWEADGYYDKVDINIDLTGSLENRVASLDGVFIEPIYMGSNNSNNSDIQASVKTIQCGLDDIKPQIDSIINQVNNLFDLVDNSELNELLSSSSSSLSIIEKIQKLIEFLGTKISEAEIARDKILKAYNVYVASATDIRVDYNNKNDLYQSIWSEFSTYLGDYVSQHTTTYGTYTMTNLINIKAYVIKEDEKNRLKIINWFQEQTNKYLSYMDEFNSLNTDEIELLQAYTTNEEYTYVYQYESEVLEQSIQNMHQALLDDVTAKTNIGNIQIEKKIQEYEEYMSIIINYSWKWIKDSFGIYKKNEYRRFETELLNNTSLPFDQLITNIYDVLEYRNEPLYKQGIMMMKTYSGNYDIAYDSYYNHKNLTHPSFQIHPFLWNFVEKSDVDNTLENITHYITNLNYDDLEIPLVQYKIDNYIGEFGNVINKWNSDIADFSGYTTSYENRNHICQYTGVYSQVINYDGAFYPEALNEYIKNGNTTTIDTLSSYYHHLKYYNSKDSINLINNNLSNNYDEIKEIIKDTKKEDVYDIFRYFEDAWGNKYILYKKYGKENPTEKEKLHTEGKIYIRLNDTPLAFPIESVINKNSYSQLIKKELHFYDIDIMEDGKRIILMYKEKDNNTVNSNIYCIALYIRSETLDGTGINDLYLTDYNDNSIVVGEQSQSKKFPSSVETNIKKEYLGYYNDETTSTVVYIDHKIENGKDIGIDNEVKITLFGVTDNRATNSDSNSVMKYEHTFDICELYDKTQDPSFAYYGQLDFAFITKRESIENNVTVQNREVNLLSNTNGYAYDDFSQDEMNSHDIFNNDITIVTIPYPYNTSYKKLNIQKYNINTDIGYIGLYPGINKNQSLDIRNELITGYQSIELLGQSKNLCSLINILNENPNPYTTKEQIQENKLYGRVYEDFDINSDKSINIYQNNALYKNMPSRKNSEYYFDGEKYEWTINLNNFFDQNQISNLTLICYSTTSLGKNPYIFENVENLISNSIDPETGSMRKYDANYRDGKEYIKSDYDFDFKGNKYKVIGTCNGINEINAYFSNKLTNISKFQYMFFAERNNNKLRLILTLEDKELNTFIKEGTIRVAVLNTKDLRVLESYHFLDSYGFISSYGNNAVYTDANNRITYLSSISLSNTLEENIYALATSYRLMFKYSEEDVFDTSDLNYYFPCLNVKLPYTCGNYFNDNFVKAYKVIEDDQYIRIYNELQEYTIEAQLSNVLEELNNIYINQENGQCLLRVYEDYLEKEDGEYPYNKYDIHDPKLYKYVHFCSTNPIETEELSVPISCINKVYIDTEKNSDKFSKWILNKNLNCISSESLTSNQDLQEIFSYDDLDDEEKTKFKNNIDKFLRLYISYQKAQNGIDLYVNYQNYINSPFVKVENNEYKVEIIKDSYARIPQNETGYVNLVLQFCIFNGDEIQGTKIINVGRYQITNISDDKPKFILKKVQDYDTNSFKDQKVKYLTLKGEKKYIFKKDEEQKVKYNIYLDSNTPIEKETTCRLIYDAGMFYFDPEDNTQNYHKETDGVLFVKFQNHNRNINIPFTINSDIPHSRIGKPSTFAIVDEYTENNIQIGIENGFIIIKNNTIIKIDNNKYITSTILPTVYSNSNDEGSYTYINIQPKEELIYNDGEIYEVLEKNKDYTVDYYDNTVTLIARNIGDVSESTAHVKITGKGIYSGVIDLPFTLRYTRNKGKTVLETDNHNIISPNGIEQNYIEVKEN